MLGTPLQNNVDELYSLLKFLEFKPFNDHGQWCSVFVWCMPLNDVCPSAVFKAQISEPLGRGRSKVALERLRVIMQAIMLRRTKTTKIDGRPLLNLPARNVALEKVLFTAEEQDYYNQLEQKMKRKLNSFKQVRLMRANAGKSNLAYTCFHDFRRDTAGITQTSCACYSDYGKVHQEIS